MRTDGSRRHLLIRESSSTSKVPLRLAITDVDAQGVGVVVSRLVVDLESFTESGLVRSRRSRGPVTWFTTIRDVLLEFGVEPKSTHIDQEAAVHIALEEAADGFDRDRLVGSRVVERFPTNETSHVFDR